MFELTFTDSALEDLRCFKKAEQNRILDAIEEQLPADPLKQTRNRKPLRQPAPFEATWELRCGPDNRFRVFYDVDLESQTVQVLAIGVKDRERLLIGGEEYES